MNMLNKIKAKKPTAEASGSEDDESVKKTRAPSPLKKSAATPSKPASTTTTRKHRRIAEDDDEGQGQEGEVVEIDDDDAAPLAPKRHKPRNTAPPVFPLPEPPASSSSASPAEENEERELFGDPEAPLDIETHAPTPQSLLARLLELASKPPCRFDGKIDRVVLRNAILRVSPSTVGYMSACAVSLRPKLSVQVVNPFVDFETIDEWKPVLFNLLRVFGITQELLQGYAAEHKITQCPEELLAQHWTCLRGCPTSKYDQEVPPPVFDETLKETPFAPVAKHSAWDRYAILDAMLSSKDPAVRCALYPIAVAADSAVRIKFAKKVQVTNLSHHFICDLLDLPSLSHSLEEMQKALSPFGLIWFSNSKPAQPQEPKIV
jgi:hypothetical protein